MPATVGQRRFSAFCHIIKEHSGKMSAEIHLVTVDEAKRLEAAQVADIFCKFMNPGQYHFLKLLGFHKVIIDSAEGLYYIARDGRRILDFFGCFGAIACGHNHSRISAVRRKFQEEHRHEMAIAFMSQYAAALSRNLAALAPGDLEMSLLCCSGSEAVEAALKLAERTQGSRNRIAYAEQSFHGKTRGALSVTDGELYRAGFQLLPNCVRVPFGDAAALEEEFRRDPEIGTLILESIQGGAGIVVPPDGYLKDVRRLCDEHNVVWIADEVQCGMGRTGRFFAFAHEEVIPDIVTLAKALGGGKCAIGAMIARKPLYLKAYGTPKTALIHGPATFGAMGEACCTAIETLNILVDENLMRNAEVQGEYLAGQLTKLQTKYPSFIKEVRGRGLMMSIEFHDFSKTLPLGLKQIISRLDEKLKGSLCGFIGCLLLADHDVLVAFTEYNRNVIRLEPPLIVTKDHIDILIKALDDLLASGVTGIVMKYARQFLKK
jgi:acetylornithine/succinyldiaminopimelate/putrescine aminotransferase